MAAKKESKTRRMQAATRSRLTLACILITILIDMIGVGIIVPVLPELLEELTGGSVAQAAVIGGYLVFAYAFMQFVFSPVLGNLSDRFGRRPVLLLSLLGLTFDYLMMSIAPFVWYLFITAASSPALRRGPGHGDGLHGRHHPPHKRTHRFGLIGAAFGLGFIIGPVVGGELGELGPRVPFYAAAALAFSNFLFGLFVLPESLPRASRRKFDIRRANPLGAVLALKKYPSVLWLLGVLFFFQLSAQALPTVFSYFTVEMFSFSSSLIGRTLGAFGLGFAFSQAVLAGPSPKALASQPWGSSASSRPPQPLPASPSRPMSTSSICSSPWAVSAGWRRRPSMACCRGRCRTTARASCKAPSMRRARSPPLSGRWPRRRFFSYYTSAPAEGHYFPALPSSPAASR